MDKIRPWLYIGNYSDTQNKNGLDFKSIQAMLQLASPIKQIGITSLYLPVNDMSPVKHELFKQGTEFVLTEKKKGNKILVACAAGVNRSSAFCIATLKESEGLSLLDAFKEVKRNRPQIMPHELVWESLCGYYNENTPYLDMLRASVQIH